MIEVLGPVNRDKPHTIITIRKQPTILPWLRKVPLAVGRYIVNGDVRIYLADRLAKRLAAAGVLHARYVDPKAELIAAVNSKKNPPVDPHLMGFIAGELQKHEQEEQAKQAMALIAPAVAEEPVSVAAVDPPQSNLDGQTITSELSPQAAALMREALDNEADRLVTDTWAAIGSSVPLASSPSVTNSRTLTSSGSAEVVIIDEVTSKDSVQAAETLVNAADQQQMDDAVATIDALTAPVAEPLMPKKRKRRTAAEMAADRAAELETDAAEVQKDAVLEGATPAPASETPGST